MLNYTVMDSNILSVFVILICAVVASDQSLLNEKVMTIIDISSQLVKVKERVTILNDRLEPATSYIYIVDPLRKDNLSYIEAEDDRENSLYVNKITTNDSSVRFEIVFHNSISPDMTDTIDVHTVFINCLQSYPKSVKQHEKHFVVFKFNVYYYSLYFTELQTLVINAGPIDVNTLAGETYRLANTSKDGLQYGPFNDKKSEAIYHTSIHYETNSPFLVVESLDRFIQISHWGYINTKDKVSLKHTGPKLTGPFERLIDYNKRDTRIESFVASLPEGAFDIYMKDEIGLISSFSVHYDNPNSVDVHIKPRFVLYGGWKTQFEIGYSLDIKYYVSYDKTNRNLFNIFVPLVNRLYQNMFIKKAKLNIILPEGAMYQDINPYYELENNTQKKHCYFIDITCREVVSFEVHNLVDYHSTTNIQVTYSFPQIHLFTKPLVLSAFIYTLFMLVLIYIRLTSNSSPTRERNQSRLRTTHYVNPATAAAFNRQEETIQIVAKKEGKQNKKLPKSRIKSRKN